MKTQVTSVRRVVSIPDGKYEGTWRGYVVNFVADGVEYEADTEVGLRGRSLSVPCVVTVELGVITVEER